MPRLKVMRRVQLGMLLEPGEIIEVSPDKATKLMRRYRRYFVTVGDEEAGRTHGTRDREATLEDKGIASARRVGLPVSPEERPEVENRMAAPDVVSSEPEEKAGSGVFSTHSETPYRSHHGSQWTKKRPAVRDDDES